MLRALEGQSGGIYNQGFRYLKAAQFLGIPWTEIENTPTAILENAFNFWEAERAADHHLAAKRGF